jgi:hypothetical protein
MDDFFGWGFAENMVFYCGKLRLKHQVQLLLFWDAISCPFEDKKQEHGAELKVIRLCVNINHSSISLPPSSITDITDKITKSYTSQVAEAWWTPKLAFKCDALGETGINRAVLEDAG